MATKTRYAFVIAPFLLLLGCSSSTPSSSGCTKDTECASGRVCGEEGRCVDRASVNANDDTAATDGSASGATTSAAETGTLVDVCSASLSCNIARGPLLGVERGAASMAKVDGHCHWNGHYIGLTVHEQLAPNGTTLTYDGEPSGGVWTSDAMHVVLNYGAGNVIVDCKP